MLSLRNLEPEDLPEIAKLHLDHMPLTFPSCRPYFNLMKLVYSSFLFHEEGFCGVATMDSDVIGFVCFHKRPKEIYASAFRKNPVGFCWNIAQLLLRFPAFFLKGVPRVLRALHLSRSGKPSTASVPDFWKDLYELRPMVVRKDKQGTPAAGQLISWGEKVLMNRGEDQYFLRVRKDNPRAIAFYNKMGLTTVADEDIRIVMVKDLKGRR
jgi:hypothetical protein